MTTTTDPYSAMAFTNLVVAILAWREGMKWESVLVFVSCVVGLLITLVRFF